MAKAVRRVSFFLFVFTLTVAAAAQDLPDIAQGLQPYAAYHGGDLDVVSMANGGLTVRIPLISYPQKGSLELSYSVVFSSFAFLDEGQCSSSEGGSDGGIVLNNDCTDTMMFAPVGLSAATPPGPFLVLDQALLGAGASGAEPIQSPTPPIDTRLYVIASDNSQHALGATADGYRSLDDSDYLFIPDAPITSAIDPYPAVNPSAADPGQPTIGGVNGTVIDSSGRRYRTNTITDTDGNQIQISPSGVTDSAGRTIPSPTAGDTATCPQLSQAQYQPLVGAQVWIVPGPGGTSRYIFCYANVNIASHFEGMTDAPDSAVRELNTQVAMLQSIVLPNGTYWGFVYDSNNPNTPFGPTGQTAGLGQLMTLIYPTGGSVRYTYDYLNGPCDGVRKAGLANVGTSVETWIPQITSRTMVDANGSTAGQWTYTGGKIISMAGDVTIYDAGAVPPNNESCFSGVNAGNTVYSADPASGGKKLKSTVNSYWNGTNFVAGFPGAAIIRETGTTTTLYDANGNAYTSSVQKSFDPNSEIAQFWATSCDSVGNNCGPGLAYTAPIGKPTLITYTNFDGSTLKEEQTQYRWQSNGSSYRTANLLDIPSSTSTLDASGNPIATTTYAYDESSYSPGGTRGHATTISRTLNINSGPAPTIHTGWNANGQRIYTIDANQNHNSYGHTTDYQYNQCNGSLVSDTYNALNQHTSGAYDCNAGRLTSLTDPNGNTTQVSWDGMGRLLGVRYPMVQLGTPTTTFCYQDDQSCNASSPNTVVKTVAGAPDPNQITTVVFDGFGREIHRYGSDPQGQDEIDTTYDADGRVYTVTNPYRSTGDPTYGITTTIYDALNRKLNTQEPDGSTLMWQYTGPSVDSWDEAGVHHQQTSDALGRLTKVLELGTSSSPLSLETDYNYDPLGNLLSATQHGTAGETPRYRSFTYDSLSRLISSMNPETGTICYGQWNGGGCVGGYDGNGNLVHKTDSNGTVSGFWYDALNRVTSESYSDGITPSNFYAYDVAPGYMPDLQNTIGRLTYSGNAYNGGTSGKATATTYSYDAMGRIVREWEQTPSVSPGGFFVYSNYDLAGNLTDLTYPDGRHITQSTDSAGRLASVTESGAGTTYLSGPSGNVQYWPSGEVSASTYGKVIAQTFTVNSRLQPTSSLATLAATNTTLLNRQVSYTNGGTSNCPSQPADNGNIYSIVDSLQPNNAQYFCYDGLNRIISGYRADNAYNHIYNYDSFGNLTLRDNLASGSAVVYGIDPATNRLLRSHDGGVTWGDYVYDASGTLTQSSDGIGQTHTYQHNPLGQLLSIDGGAASYVYNESGQRAFKQTASGTTEYLYFNGQPITERAADGSWTDYIYANGQKIVRLDSEAPALHVHGNDCSTCSPSYVDTTFSSPISGYQIKAGDELVLLQRQVNVTGGIQLQTSEGGSTWPYIVDQNGDIANDETSVSDGLWHQRIIDLSSFANQHVSIVRSTLSVAPPPNVVWDTYLRDVAIVSADGSVHAVYEAGMQPSFNQYTPGTATSLSADANLVTNNMSDSLAAAHYYLDDHLGSTQMELSSGGWPVWSGQFTPFGQEIVAGQVLNTTLGPQNGDGTNMHYKFTGKERDSESGLDYFGARYYASNVGRWISADWAQKPEAVPYSKLDDPQSLNLYEYVGNNPLSKADPDGHCWPFCNAIAPVSAWLGSHPSVGEAFNKIGDHFGATARIGVGHAEDIKGVKTEASATLYVKASDGKLGVGIDLKAGANVKGVGGETTANIPIVKDGQLTNPAAAANLSGSGNVSGDVGKNGNAGASVSSEEVSAGGTYGEGVVAGGEITNSGVGNFLHSVGNAIVDDIKNEVDQVRRGIDKLKNPD